VASKYDKVFPRLKKLPVEDMGYQQKANVVKDTILSTPKPEGSILQHDELVRTRIELILEDYAAATKELVEVIMAGIGGRQHAVVMARYWLLLRQCEKHVDEQLKSIRLLLYAVEQLGVEQFSVEGTGKIGLDDLGTVYVQPEVVVKVRDKDALRDWYVKQGLFRELNAHHGTTTSQTKVLLLKGEPEPDGVEAFFNEKFTK
jgi:hypothetical protein